MDNKTILYVGNFKFPDKNATSQRILGNAKMFRDLGYSVILIGADKLTLIDPINTKREDYGFTSYMLPYPKKTTDWLKYNKQFNKLEELIETIGIKKEITHIVVYGSPSLSLWGKLLQKWCRKNKIAFIVDCVDWMPASRGNLLFRLTKWIDTYYQKKYLNSGADGIIVVSSYLEKFYSKRNRNVIIVPPLVDSKQKKFQMPVLEDNEHVTKLIYVGSPFPKDNKLISPNKFKDRIDKLILYLNEINQDKINFRLDIYGISEKDYLNKLPGHKPILKNMQSYIRFHGYCNHQETLRYTSNSDFFIFVRDKNKMTMSGFPTKFVEALSVGTPVITNDTSDLNNYLINGKNGYFISESTPKAIEDLKQILLLPKSEIKYLKSFCKTYTPFDYRHFIKKTHTFLTETHQ